MIEKLCSYGVLNYWISKYDIEVQNRSNVNLTLDSACLLQPRRIEEDEFYYKASPSLFLLFV